MLQELKTNATTLYAPIEESDQHYHPPSQIPPSLWVKWEAHFDGLERALSQSLIQIVEQVLAMICASS